MGANDVVLCSFKYARIGPLESTGLYLPGNLQLEIHPSELPKWHWSRSWYDWENCIWRKHISLPSCCIEIIRAIEKQTHFHWEKSGFIKIKLKKERERRGWVWHCEHLNVNFPIFQSWDLTKNSLGDIMMGKSKMSWLHWEYISWNAVSAAGSQAFESRVIQELYK